MRKKLLAVSFAMLMGLAGVACDGNDKGRDGDGGVEIEGDLEGEGGEGEVEGGDGED